MTFAGIVITIPAVFSLPTPVAVSIGSLPAGMAGTRITVQKMVAMIRTAITSATVRTVALAIAQRSPERDAAAQAAAIFAWVQDHYRFRRDPVGVESLSRPEYMLRQIFATGYAYGDCDDVTMLICALAGALGIPSRVRIIKFKGYSSFSHVVAALQTMPGYFEEFDGTKRAGMVSSLPVVERSETATIIP